MKYQKAVVKKINFNDKHHFLAYIPTASQIALYDNPGDAALAAAREFFGTSEGVSVSGDSTNGYTASCLGYSGDKIARGTCYTITNGVCYSFYVTDW